MQIVVVSDQEHDFTFLNNILANTTATNNTLERASTLDQARFLLLQQIHDIGIVAASVANNRGVALIEECVSKGCAVPLILMAETFNPSLDELALEAGATDFLAKDRATPEHVFHMLRYAVKQAQKTTHVQTIERQMEALIKNSPISIFAVNMDGMVTLAAGSHRRFGKEMAGKSIYQIFADEPIYIEKIEQSLKGQPVNDVLEYRGRIFDCWYAPILSKAGKVTGVIGFSQDVTERRWFEETFQHYTSELEARTRELHAYNYTIAHDLKSPLAMILGYASLMVESFSDDISDEFKTFTQEILKAGQNMRNMIDQLLYLASETKIRENRKILDVQMIVETALFRFKYQMELGRVQAHVDANLPPALGHAPWVEQIFANLIGNAVKYRGKENPTIWIRGHHQGEFVRYEVQDNGIGIAEENQKTIFDLFGRVHSLNVEGSGIGLAIVQRMVKKLDGEIGVSSRLGKGSTFWFTLPTGSAS